ncbi:MAG: LLM class F420-dependent oxidoreductase [Pseudomonadaceae bacterium]|nr:LLM class F420-dependent oxidoreductase [Pseudomonadaceae bacterium]
MADFGVLIFPTDYSIDPGDLAVEVEARGFESFFVTEHTHIPASRVTPWPGGRELPREYWSTYDPYIALATAAARTTTLRVGTGITLVTEHNPISLAKTIASLDKLSGGRVVLGIGAGWNVEEMANHGVDASKRWPITRERVLAMRAIWSESEPEFHGEHVNFDPIWSEPKPASPGGPPILLGASSKFSFARVAEYCDGWMPIFADHDRSAASGAPNYAQGIDTIKQLWAERGRAGQPDFSIFGCPPKRNKLESLVDMGFNRLIFGLPSADADTVLPLLDKYAELAGSLNQTG